MTAAKPVVDPFEASRLLGLPAEMAALEPAHYVEFFNPSPRIVDIREPGVTYGFSPGRNICTDAELASKLKIVAAHYGIKVYEAH